MMAAEGFREERSRKGITRRTPSQRTKRRGDDWSFMLARFNDCLDLADPLALLFCDTEATRAYFFEMLEIVDDVVERLVVNCDCRAHRDARFGSEIAGSIDGCAGIVERRRRNAAFQTAAGRDMKYVVPFECSVIGSGVVAMTCSVSWGGTVGNTS